ncbi:Dopey, N-terminal-domain-containing protein [Panaeolus papilionaceus]|nr:Dopey, N-terminal-domain-containing protein [Panaeolus papilionaceus]
MASGSASVSGVEGAANLLQKGSAWVTARTTERTLVAQAYSTDPKFKKYSQQVEKCLNSFDNVHEWADCISFLKQLLKTFQSYTQFKEIPRKVIVAKRLSQCLNPALPSGVHQKALEVYIHILGVLEVEGLKRDLNIWSSGLFPFFEYAATSVKPTLLSIYETYYLPVQTGLRPVMKSFILALLPGLEEETGEFFEKVISILDRLSGTVSPSFFFQNIWLVMLTTPSARGTALNFLSRRLPKLQPNEDITDVVGKDIGLMIRAFAAALEDDNLLVRRAALDILLQSLAVNSSAIRKAQREDKEIIMRAATGVVLRRDLSLNRRLYTWLLGPDEKSESQIAYLKDNALDLLTMTLRNEMNSPSGEYAESRPFKIFISLLDKWEIGAPITESLAYDAFKAVKKLVESASDHGEDLSMTANTLYEAVEPQMLWKDLLSTVFEEISGKGDVVEGLKLVRFILKSFTHDEEMQTIHFPVIFAAILDIVHTQVLIDEYRAEQLSIREAFSLLEDMLPIVPHSALTQRPEITVERDTSKQSAFQFACTFFKIQSSTDTTSEMIQSSIPFDACFQFLVSITTGFSKLLCQTPHNRPALREVLTRALVILDHIMSRLMQTVRLTWDPKQWLDSMLATVQHETTIFAVADRLISLIISLNRNQHIEPRISIENRPVMSIMINKLLKYLHPDFATYHIRSINLIWALQSMTKRSYVESILAQSLTSTDTRSTADAFEAFGVLWRLSDDALLPGFHFKVPLIIILDTLKSEDPNLRRIAETWMRCSLKSYIRVLDPILYDLLDPSIHRTPTTFKVRGRELPGFLYNRPFDQRIVNHLFEVLISVITFGGQGFAKAAHTSQVKRSHHPGFIQRIHAGGLVDPEASYLDVLVEVLLRFAQSEPQPTSLEAMQPLNNIIQSNAIELLQVIVSRGEVDIALTQSIEATTIAKLYFSIHMNRLDLQNKWLHLLHSVISVSTAHSEAALRTATLKTEEGTLDTPSVSDKPNEPARYPVNPLLTQTLVDGISTRTNRAVLQHWLDFILMAVPQFQPALQSIVTPLCDCLSRQVLYALADLLRIAAQPQDFADDQRTGVSDAELIMLLSGLERLVLLSLAYTSETETSDDDQGALEKSSSEPGGLLGYVSGVFSSESTSNNNMEQLTSRSPGYRSLDEGIRVLYSVWASLMWTTPTSWSARDDSMSLIYNRTRLRCRRILEHLFRVQSGEVFESLIDWWSRDLTLSATSPDAAFELVDVLVANAQNAVHMVCESIAFRILGSSERSRKQATNSNLTDAILFKFLEEYFRRLEGPLVIQVWSRYIQLVKEVISTSKEFKPHSFSALRCLGVLSEKLIHTSALEDRKLRKELQDNYGKLLDLCVVYVGRSSDQGSWIRRSTKDSVTNGGRESPAARSAITSFVATSALPNLRKILIENDRVVNACNNIVYYVVNPAMRGKTRPMDVDATVIQIFYELTKIPAALKSWKSPMLDLLNDNRLFNCNPNDAARWKPIVKAFYDSDKTAMPELLGKVASAPSANIFTNREYEMLLRSLNLRRLSYIIFTGEKNHFLPHLPTIQERLVDIFRSVPSPIVQSEVFLCIRILLCRLSPNNLTSFWPVILTEMYGIFERTIASLPADGSEELLLILAACKCLDTLIVLQTEEFQIHQWIFITDTVDAVYRPDGWFPEAIMDQLAEMAGNLPVVSSRALPEQFPAYTDDRPMRRPLLSHLRHIESIRDLIPFFSNISVSSYESVYTSGGNVDWEAVEKGILEDMFDGR